MDQSKHDPARERGEPVHKKPYSKPLLRQLEAGSSVYERARQAFAEKPGDRLPD